MKDALHDFQCLLSQEAQYPVWLLVCSPPDSGMLQTAKPFYPTGMCCSSNVRNKISKKGCSADWEVRALFAEGLGLNWARSVRGTAPCGCICCDSHWGLLGSWDPPHRSLWPSGRVKNEARSRLSEGVNICLTL